MNLEQRVQALEQEVQLLKAQIQATLLDIQEQVLNGTYPMLRGEEAAVKPAAPAAQSVVKTVAPTPTPEPSAPEAVMPSPVKRITFKDTDLDLEDDDDDLEPVMTVTPNPRRAAPVPPPTPEPKPEPMQIVRSDWTEWDESQPQQQKKNDKHEWIELENWVGQKVEQLGIKRTRELINVYMRQERFTRQERDLLLQFVNAYDTVEGPAETPPSTVISSAIKSKPVPERPTIVPQTRAVVEEIRDELRHKHTANGRRSEVHYEISEQQQLVLRLIAGILSAGDEISNSSNGHGGF